MRAASDRAATLRPRTGGRYLSNSGCRRRDPFVISLIGAVTLTLTVAQLGWADLRLQRRVPHECSRKAARTRKRVRGCSAPLHSPLTAALFGVATGAWLIQAANWWVNVIQAPSSCERRLLLVTAGVFTTVAVGFLTGLCLTLQRPCHWS